MNHAAIVEHESGRVARLRCYVLHCLDDRHFAAMNSAPVRRDEHGYLVDAGPSAVDFFNGYCLEAPHEMPAGGMHSYPPDEYHRARGPGRAVAGAMIYTERGLTLDDIRERDAFVEKIVAEILAERANHE